MMLEVLLFPLQVEYPEIEEGGKPRYRFMSAYEQRVEPTDKNYMCVQTRCTACTQAPSYCSCH